MIPNELNTRCAMDEYIQGLKDENNRLKEMLYESAIQGEWPTVGARPGTRQATLKLPCTSGVEVEVKPNIEKLEDLAAYLAQEFHTQIVQEKYLNSIADYNQRYFAGAADTPSFFTTLKEDWPARNTYLEIVKGRQQGDYTINVKIP